MNLLPPLAVVVVVKGKGQVPRSPVLLPKLHPRAPLHPLHPQIKIYLPRPGFAEGDQGEELIVGDEVVRDNGIVGIAGVVDTVHYTTLHNTIAQYSTAQYSNIQCP